MSFNGGCSGVVNPSDRRGGTLRLATAAAVDSLDPARTYYVWGWMLQRLLQRTVMAYPAAPGTTRLVPDLASEPGSPSRGGTVWRYALRRGIRFADGTPVTAADVKYAIERLFAQDVLAGGPTYLIDLLDDPGAPYPGPFRDPDGLRTIEVPDEQTIVFHLRKPFPDFDHLMAMPVTAPVPRHADAGARYGDAPVSTGPYRVAQHEPGRHLLLERNPWWGADSLRRALPDRIDVSIGLDRNDIDDGVIAGRFHLNLEGRGVQLRTQQRLAAAPELLANADNPATGFLHYIAIQPQVPPFGNIHARRAVHYAADRTALLEARGGPIYGGDIATTLLPPTLAGHRADDRYPAGPHGDLAAARAELARAGLPDGFDTVIATQPGKFRGVADALARSLARVGIRVEVQELDVSRYYREELGRPATVRSRGLGLAVTDWGADFPAAYGFAAPLVDGRLIKPFGGNHNFAELNDPRINALIDRAQSEPEPLQRAGIWQEIDRAVMEHAVILPLTHDRTLHYRHESATNVYVHAAFGVYDIQGVGVRAPQGGEECSTKD
ncbi:MAG TPA: ABC transporter substrate-binding protein [Nakamurella sp.]